MIPKSGTILIHMELYAYTDTWDENDPHANFKTDVAHYTVTDPLPTLEGLSAATGIPVPCLVRYVLVKYAASGADAMLAMGPLVLHQMEKLVAKAEEAGTEAAKVEAYEALKGIVKWLRAGMEL
jgi:hypothetical protein